MSKMNVEKSVRFRNLMRLLIGLLLFIWVGVVVLYNVFNLGVKEELFVGNFKGDIFNIVYILVDDFGYNEFGCYG